ncbi:hypothetical protein Tco_0672433 [Tanacetum coccineum]
MPESGCDLTVTIRDDGIGNHGVIHIPLFFNIVRFLLSVSLIGIKCADLEISGLDHSCILKELICTWCSGYCCAPGIKLISNLLGDTRGKAGLSLSRVLLRSPLLIKSFLQSIGRWTHDKLLIMAQVAPVVGTLIYAVPGSMILPCWANEFHQDKASSVRVPVANLLAVLIGVPLCLVFLLVLSVFTMVVACASRAAETLSATSFLMAARVMAGAADIDTSRYGYSASDSLGFSGTGSLPSGRGMIHNELLTLEMAHQRDCLAGGVKTYPVDEDPTDKDGDNGSTPYRVYGIRHIVGEQIRHLDCKTQYAVLSRRFDTSYPIGGYDILVMFMDMAQNQKDLPRDNLLVSVEVLRYDLKRSKSENKGIVSTEMELLLEQPQQGSYKDGDGDGDTLFQHSQVHNRMLILDQHLCQNPESSSKGFNASTNSDINFFLSISKPQDDERSQDDDQRLDLADDLKKSLDHISSTNTSHKTKITTSKYKISHEESKTTS